MMLMNALDVGIIFFPMVIVFFVPLPRMLHLWPSISRICFFVIDFFKMLFSLDYGTRCCYVMINFAMRVCI